MAKRPRVWSQAQRENWHHNMFLGHVKRMRLAATDIARAPTTTDEARNLANKIDQAAFALDKALRTRRPKEN